MSRLLPTQLRRLRVLIGDLAETGALVVHRTAGGCGPDLALLDRVLTGPRKL